MTLLGTADKCLTCLDNECKVRHLEECDPTSASSIPGLGMFIEDTNTATSYGCLELEYLEVDLYPRKLKQCIVLTDEDFCQNVQSKLKIVDCQVQPPTQNQERSNSVTEDYELKEKTTEASTITEAPSPPTHASSSSAKPTVSPTSKKPPTKTTKTSTTQPTKPSTATTKSTSKTTETASTQTSQPSITTTKTSPQTTLTTEPITEPSKTTTTALPSRTPTEPTEEPNTSQEPPNPTSTPEPEVTTKASASFIVRTNLPILAIVALVIHILQ
nr:unnamed protein product [Callosobruchus chinensis]